MSKYKNYHILSLLFLLLLPLSVWSAGTGNPVSDELSRKDIKGLVENITADYKEWNKASLNCKVKSDMLPIAVSMRVSMERDKNLFVSMRVPLFGEVARVEMTPGHLMLINKKNKTYHELEYDNERALLPYAQSLLLGRVVVIGVGELTMKNASSCRFYRLGEECDDCELIPTGWAVVPDTFADGLSYGYTIDTDYRITGVAVSVVRKLIEAMMGNTGNEIVAEEEYVQIADIDIEYKNSGKSTASLSFNFDRYKLSAILDCDTPEYGGKLLDPIELTPRYREVSIREVLRF